LERIQNEVANRQNYRVTGGNSKNAVEKSSQAHWKMFNDDLHDVWVSVWSFFLNKQNRMIEFFTDFNVLFLMKWKGER
tara:strand:+ start:105 stop:338 length:234 start_codon:yes stop_codon:yes gene_type:complete